MKIITMLITTFFSAFIVLFAPHVLAQQAIVQEAFVQVGGPKGLSEPGIFPSEILLIPPMRNYTFRANSFTQSGGVVTSGPSSATRAQPTISDITLTKTVGISSLNFQTALYSGQILPTVTIDFINRGSLLNFMPFSQIALANVRVAAVQRT